MASKQQTSGSHVPLVHQLKEKSGKIRKSGSRSISSTRKQPLDATALISSQSVTKPSQSHIHHTITISDERLLTNIKRVHFIFEIFFL